LRTGCSSIRILVYGNVYRFAVYVYVSVKHDFDPDFDFDFDFDVPMSPDRDGLATQGHRLPR
ncbi:MAG TPA: hypothetical protein DEW46_09130, partial [Verrucomicrobia bacterium]|nr:hypothetical protein [Verrucomicrobiota bacterium]